MIPSNDILSRFEDLQEQAAQAAANQDLGSIGWWPDQGSGQDGSDIHDVLLESVAYSNEKFGYGGRNDCPRKEIDATGVQVVLRLLDDPASPTGEPRSFKDSQFILVSDSQFATLPETEDKSQGGKQQTRCRITMERFKGFLKTVLQRDDDIADIHAAILALEELRETMDQKGEAIVLKVRLAYGKRNDGSPRPDNVLYRERTS